MLTIAESPVRRCGRCGLTKSVSDFNASSEFGLQYWCRACQSDWYRTNKAHHVRNVNANTDRYRERNAAFVLAYLNSHPCVDCGEADPVVLEFDHVRGKDRPVSRLRWGNATIERIAAEIAKCQVRCVNCHMRRTATTFGWRKAGDG